tara:strand:+ start:3448 stop:3705 length:258 start_codon:yes stop_codon:yes gene_type:complete
MPEGFSEENVTEGSKEDLENKEKGSKSSWNLLSKLPKTITYTLPGRKQRLFLGTFVILLNMILLLAIYLYFNNETFHNFIFQIGR